MFLTALGVALGIVLGVYHQPIIEFVKTQYTKFKQRSEAPAPVVATPTPAPAVETPVEAPKQPEPVVATPVPAPEQKPAEFQGAGFGPFPTTPVETAPTPTVTAPAVTPPSQFSPQPIKVAPGIYNFAPDARRFEVHDDGFLNGMAFNLPDLTGTGRQYGLMMMTNEVLAPGIQYVVSVSDKPYDFSNAERFGSSGGFSWGPAKRNPLDNAKILDPSKKWYVNIKFDAGGGAIYAQWTTQ